MKKINFRFQIVPLIFLTLSIILFGSGFYHPSNTFAQEFKFQRKIGTIPVMVNDIHLGSPFDGGRQESKPVFADIDDDGDWDLFVGGIDGRIRLYLNTDSSFILQITALDSINVASASAPAFADIDNDGDWDLFIGEKDGTITLFPNCGDSLRFEFNPDERITNFASIDVGMFSTPAFDDIDKDGKPDLFVGNETGDIIFLRNISDSTNYTFISMDTIRVSGSDKSTPALADIDNDGNTDLFVGEFDGNINFYRIVRDSTKFIFTLVKNDFALIDIGFNSAPVFVDIDNDNKLDLFVGEFDGNINFYRNTGDSEKYFNPSPDIENFVSADIGRRSAPTFIDIDNDNDLDMFIGEIDGNIIFSAIPVTQRMLPLP